MNRLVWSGMDDYIHRILYIVVIAIVSINDPIWRGLVELWQDRRPPAGLEPC